MSADATARALRKPGEESRPPLMSVRDLTLEGFTGGAWHRIVDGVSFDLHAGEVVGLIGESGAGKSSIGLAALGYVRPGCRFAGGCVLFQGQDLTRLPDPAVRALRGRRIAYVAQSAAAAFNPARRLLSQVVEVAVREGARTRKEAETDAVHLFRRLALPDPGTIGERYPHELSGGQLQRAMIAMAMICRPEIIVFDEPTTALDVTTQVEVLAAMRAVVADFGTAAIYITHDLAVVAQLAHRIVVLKNGRVVEEAATRRMLAAPAEDYTRSLWAVRKIQKPAARARTPLLEVSGLAAAYGSLKVLDDVSLTVGRGETVALVGESGSGKSSLARVIAGLLPPAAGTMTLAGAALRPRLRDRDRETLRRIQLIYQSPDAALNPRQTIRDAVGRPLSFYHGLAPADHARRLRDLMEMVELPSSFLDRRPGALSGGQKQRVCIARALAASPDLIICDEVTSALDQIVQAGVLDLLVRLQRDLALSFLFITHDIATVRAIADEVVVMHRGRIVERGGRDDVLGAPKEDYTRLLLSSVPDVDPDWLTRHLGARPVPAASVLPETRRQ